MNHKNSSVKTKNHKLLENKLNNKKIRKIYSKFEKSLNLKEHFAVAVSGGPDSLALAFLAKIYSIKKKLGIRIFIVDHKLRSESTNEANLVKRVLNKHFIAAKILTWKGKKPIKNIQSIARMNRFRLIFEECKKSNIRNILIGQHQGDLYENFFIRMVRGSGLRGLISFDKKSKVNNINLLRPLLDQNKQDLIFISKHIFKFYVEDPSNNDEKYQRVKIREFINKLKIIGLDKIKFTKTLNNLKHSNEAINFYVEENMRKNSFLLKSNRLVLNEHFFQQPYEIVFRAFSEAIKIVGKKYYFARGKKLDKIIRDIKDNKIKKATLGGCVLEKVNQTVIIQKEG